ncbi:integral membrane protein [Sclerotinia borealis F-4128]|uniref:Integral membrane protein n=1 Tax=Sclerotinia borealis (strain F-4128) TaxID=1432307 RepID=W9CG47_SCLBF|nr:integral membrane protein [Sclerotinia borealis F-4128]
MSPSPYPEGTPYCGEIVLYIAVSFSVLETIFVALRYWAQYLARKPFGIDDGLILLAYLLCTAGTAVALVGITTGGIGYHVVDVAVYNPTALILWAKILVIGAITYTNACCVPKIVILCLYLRIFTGKYSRLTCYILISVILSVAVADTIAAAVMCLPLNYLWDKSIPGGKCVNIPALYRYGSLPNAVTDIFILVVPIPTVWRLQVEMKVKIGLTITFATGSIGMITSIVRCVEFFTHNPVEDGTWNGVRFLYWSIIEPAVYLIAACLPCYRPLIKPFTRKLNGSLATRERTNSKHISGYGLGTKSGDRSGFEDLESGTGTVTGKGTEDYILKEIRITTSVRESDEESLVGNGNVNFVEAMGQRYGEGEGEGKRSRGDIM